MKRLKSIGIMTMGEIAVMDKDILYRMFGVDAELLIDHSWGRESTTMTDIKSYKSKSNSLSSSQVLFRDYTFDECKLIVKEMTDALCLDMIDRGVVAQSFSLSIVYSYNLNLKPSSGTVSIPAPTNYYRVIIKYILNLYEQIVQKDKPIRKVMVSCNNVVTEIYEQYNLFTDYRETERDRKLQSAVLEIKRRFGKNAVVRGMDLQSAGTAIERNRQIGGHSSGEQ